MRNLIPLFVLSGCTQPNPGPSEISLAQPLSVAADGAPISGGLAARLVTGSGQTELTWPITEVHLQLDSDGTHAWLRRLAMPLGAPAVQDPDAPEAPKGLSLRELTLDTREPIRFEVSEALPEQLTLKARAPLKLDWKLQLEDGSLYPLGPLATEPMDLQIIVEPDQIRLTGLCRENCANIPFIVSADAVALAFTAPATVTRR